jgi:hypothetical protein
LAELTTVMTAPIVVTTTASVVLVLMVLVLVAGTVMTIVVLVAGTVIRAMAGTDQDDWYASDPPPPVADSPMWLYRYRGAVGNWLPKSPMSI